MSGWIGFALASAFFAGLTAVLAKIGVKDVPSNVATLLRVAVIFPFIAGIVWFRREWLPLASISSRTLVFLALSAVTTALSWLFYFRALQLGPASLVSPLDKLSLLVAVVLSVIILGERLSVLQWGGALLMVVGTLLIAKH